MAGFDPYSTALAAAGGAASYFTGRSAAAAQKEMARRQAQLLQRQTATYNATQPTYLNAIQALAQHAAGYGQGAGPGGVFGGPEDAARFRAFEEMNNRNALQGANRLQHDLAARGIAQGSQAAALAQNERARQGATSNFGRQLQIMAPQEQERRYQQLLAALGPGMGAGGQAAAGYGQQAAVYGNQANNAYNAIGQGVQNWQQMNALRNYMGQYGVDLGGGVGGGGGGTGVVGGMTGGGYGPAASGTGIGVPQGQYGVDYYIGPDGQIYYF